MDSYLDTYGIYGRTVSEMEEAMDTPGDEAHWRYERLRDRVRMMEAKMRRGEPIEPDLPPWAQKKARRSGL